MGSEVVYYVHINATFFPAYKNSFNTENDYFYQKKKIITIRRQHSSANAVSVLLSVWFNSTSIPEGFSNLIGISVTYACNNYWLIKSWISYDISYFDLLQVHETAFTPKYHIARTKSLQLTIPNVVMMHQKFTPLQ
jgi:hypothetical protein